MSKEINQPLEQQDRESQEMKADERLPETLVVTSEAAEASRPGEAALDDPAPVQQHKALPGIRQFDDLKLNALLGRVLRGLIACVALIDEGNLNRLVSDLLNALCQVLHLISVCSLAGVTSKASRS